MEKIFINHEIDAVIHFAGLKSVGESVKKPLLYYKNNIFSTIVLSELCIKYNVHKFIFSSSATVYGNQESPLNENLNLKKTTNPYGETKAVSERVLMDTAKSNPMFKVTILRYFNPVGAHESGLIGENPNGVPNNLMPYITKVAKGELPSLSVYGNDYDTIDGSGIRDYIHVVDLAKGHIAALKNCREGINIYNLGTGRGTSVLELLRIFVDKNKVKVPYEIKGRRKGDLAISFAEVSKAFHELDWKAEKTLEDMVVDAWRYEERN